MGRLPEYWAGRKITMRIPYEMASEKIVGSLQSGQQFADAAFLHNVDKPLEVHRCKPWVTALDGAGLPIAAQPSQEILQSLLRVRITDLGKGEVMTKAPTLIALLTKGNAEQTWEWAEPYTIVRSEQFQVVVDVLSLANFVATFSQLSLGWMFQGFLLVVAPPSESR